MMPSPKSRLDAKKLLGTFLFPLGLLLLFVNLESSLAASDSILGLSSGAEGDLPTLALSLFRVIQSYFFDHARFLHGLGQILLSCWPIILILAGIVLLQNAIRSQLQAAIAPAESSNIGELS
jgi:hypothetical protein